MFFSCSLAWLAREREREDGWVGIVMIAVGPERKARREGKGWGAVGGPAATVGLPPGGGGKYGKSRK